MLSSNASSSSQSSMMDSSPYRASTIQTFQIGGRTIQASPLASRLLQVPPNRQRNREQPVIIGDTNMQIDPPTTLPASHSQPGITIHPSTIPKRASTPQHPWIHLPPECRYVNTKLFTGLKFFIPLELYTEYLFMCLSKLIEVNGGTVDSKEGLQCHWTVYPVPEELPLKMRLKGQKIAMQPVGGSKPTLTDRLHQSLLDGVLRLEIVVVGPPAPTLQNTTSQLSQGSLPPRITSIDNVHSNLSRRSSMAGTELGPGDEAVLDKIKVAIGQYDWTSKTLGDFQCRYIGEIPEIVSVMSRHLPTLYNPFEAIKVRVDAQNRKRSRGDRIKLGVVSRAGSADTVSIRSGSRHTSPSAASTQDTSIGPLPAQPPLPSPLRVGNSGDIITGQVSSGTPQLLPSKALPNIPLPSTEEWQALSNLSIPALLQQHRSTLAELHGTKTQLGIQILARQAAEMRVRTLQIDHANFSAANQAMMKELEELRAERGKLQQATDENCKMWIKLFEEEQKTADGAIERVKFDVRGKDFGDDEEVIRRREMVLKEAEEAIAQACKDEVTKVGAEGGAEPMVVDVVV